MAAAPAAADLDRATAELVDAGRRLDERGWVPATSGNLSMRLEGHRIAVTSSGAHKGRLGSGDIVIVDRDGASLDGRRPSAETLLHAQLYRARPDVGAVLHVHSVAATVISRRARGALVLEDYELLKAFTGIATHATSLRVPVFPNTQHIPTLCEAVAVELSPDLYGYLIAGHGLYTWGASMADALRHLEALDFLFECELRARGEQTP